MRDSAVAAGVRIRLGDRTMTLSAEIVREVAEIVPITPLPGASGGVLGVGSHRGTPITILDGCCLVGETAKRGDGPGALVLCQVGRWRVGLVVDDVLGVGGDGAVWDLAGALAAVFEA